MKEEKLRLIQDDLGYYHPIGCESCSEPLFILETIFHDLPAFCIKDFFEESSLGDSMGGNDFGSITDLRNNKVKISIYNLESKDGPNHEYEMAIDKFIILAYEYENLQRQRPHEIFFKKLGDDIWIESIFKSLQ